MDKINMTVKGVIVDLNDPKNLKRLKVRIPAYHGLKGEEDAVPDSNLPWCQQCLQTPVSFSVDDTVWLVFEGGDIRYPVVIGALASTTHFPDEVGQTYDTTSRIVNLNGSSISLGGKTYTLRGTTLAEVAASMIIDSYSASEKEEAYRYLEFENNGPSIGIMKWHNGYAIELMKNIHEANSDFYEESCRLFHAEDLIYDLYSGSTWLNAHFVPGTGLYSCIRQLLGNKNGPGRSVQDYMAIGDMAHYLSLGDEAGIYDNDSALYHALICYKYGEYSSPARAMRAQEDKSLTNLYNVTKYLDESSAGLGKSFSSYTVFNSPKSVQGINLLSISDTQHLKPSDTMKNCIDCSGLFGCLSDLNGFKNTSMSSQTDNKATPSLISQIMIDTFQAFNNSFFQKNWKYDQVQYRGYTIRGKKIVTLTRAAGYLYAVIQVLREETSKDYANEANITWNSIDYLNNSLTGFEKIEYNYSSIQDGDFLLARNKIYAVFNSIPLRVYACNNKNFASRYPSEWNLTNQNGEFKYILRLKNTQKEIKWHWILSDNFNIKQGFEKNHRYIEIKSLIGSKVSSPAAGTVIAVGTGVRATINNKNYGKSTNGNSVIINHKDKYVSVISHLNTINCRAGQDIGTGVIIGTVGKTGNATDPAVSFELYDINGTSIDPLSLIPINN